MRGDVSEASVDDSIEQAVFALEQATITGLRGHWGPGPPRPVIAAFGPALTVGGGITRGTVLRSSEPFHQS